MKPGCWYWLREAKCAVVRPFPSQVLAAETLSDTPTVVEYVRNACASKRGIMKFLSFSRGLRGHYRWHSLDILVILLHSNIELFAQLIVNKVAWGISTEICKKPITRPLSVQSATRLSSNSFNLSNRVPFLCFGHGKLKNGKNQDCSMSLLKYKYNTIQCLFIVAVVL